MHIQRSRQQQPMSASGQQQVQQPEQQHILQQINQQPGQPQSILQDGNQLESLVLQNQHQGSHTITAPLGTGEGPISYDLKGISSQASISSSQKQLTGVAVGVNTSKRSLDAILPNGGQNATEELYSHKKAKAGNGLSTKCGEKIDGYLPEDISTQSSSNGTSKLTPCRVVQKCLPLAKNLINHEHGWIFKDPVDPVELGIPEYFEVVEHPMDLTLVVNKLEGGHYKDIASFERDTKLVFQNAILFNGEGSDVGAMAKELLDSFAQALHSV